MRDIKFIVSLSPDYSSDKTPLNLEKFAILILQPSSQHKHTYTHYLFHQIIHPLHLQLPEG